LASTRGVKNGVKNEAETLNWSGYVVTGADGSFNQVSAEWGVPGVICSGGDQYESSWVGLDGYNGSTVEQIGTSSDCDGTTAVYSAWYEMYPAPPVYFSIPDPVWALCTTRGLAGSARRPAGTRLAVKWTGWIAAYRGDL
jgi:hypothetical protein